MDAQMLGGLGWRELVLVAAIVLLLVQTSLLTALRPTPATEGRRNGVGPEGSRDYVDRLLGPARPSANPEARR